MERILIDILGENEIITTYFKGKDLISARELLESVEDLLYEIKLLEEKIEDIYQDRKDNYVHRPMSHYTGDSNDNLYF